MLAQALSKTICYLKEFFGAKVDNKYGKSRRENVEQLWNRQVISPSSWIEILSTDFHDTELGKRMSLNQIVDWLRAACIRNKTESSNRLSTWLDKNPISEKNGKSNVSSIISKLRATHDCSKSLIGHQSDLIEVIIENVSFKSMMCFFEWKAFEALRFFMPQGHISYTDKKRPLGLYQGTRASFSVQNSLTRSAFLFYENQLQNERLWGYGYPGHDKPLRFKELRVISPTNSSQYKILSGGIVFNNRNCFILIGASYEVPIHIDEKDLRPKDIEHMQLVYYVFDDDHNSQIIRGFKPTVLRAGFDPVVPVIELERRVEGEYVNWPNFDATLDIQIGTFPAVGELSKYSERLLPKFDEKFGMYRVSTFGEL